MMYNLIGYTPLTLDIKAGEVIEIKYDKPKSINILNNADGKIYISGENDFNLKYIVINAGCYYNDYFLSEIRGGTLYIKSDGDGQISVVSGR